ncbi:hypothetical protein ASPZODRAFT_20439 [Penicilliopsis zonata CBS 506.65]|uniref:AB hydrolase-1 domain-containing protein n=1 Tax=Penicilliopsis zonata CBS 506.65 TaxID=1073090 RepID=A0A1L9S5Q0_9EURO|nr:hypothetical protein ASPZODRAFT_20439 [Penicilliopsis zonata CBS 506.65]OJJ42469.1 hypothetical protein ASPZODRAFT_20439 [Penicilliopsis zonata CBS 506.65]
MAPVQGTLHKYDARHVAFEHAAASPGRHLLLFIGGLTDGLLTTPYTTQLAQRLPAGWSLAQVLLSSSYDGFGCASVQLDVAELAACVRYFQHEQGKQTIVLLGCSTGCQDTLTYLLAPGVPRVRAGILQAPVSDREALSLLMAPGQLREAIQAAQAISSAENGKDKDKDGRKTTLPPHLLPSFMAVPMTAYRFLSLASPNHDGDDDLFSSDLTDAQLARTFGAIPAATPLCILYSGSDQFVPDTVDKEALVQRWIAASRAGTGAVDEAFSGVVPGATHTMEGAPQASLDDFFDRVGWFLQKL